MWVPSKVINWFSELHNAATANVENVGAAVQHLREDLVATRVERDALRHQLTVQQTNFDWLRMRVNMLEQERVALLEKASGIRLSAPEIVRTPAVLPNLTDQSFSFQDMGDDMAKTLGLP